VPRLLAPSNLLLGWCSDGVSRPASWACSPRMKEEGRVLCLAWVHDGKRKRRALGT